MPQSLSDEKTSPSFTLKNLVQTGAIKPVNYVQVIARVSHLESRSKLAQKWYPQVEASMLLLTLEKKANLVHYMLHAKHGHPCDERALESVLGERFAEFVRQAKSFIAS